MPGVSGVHIDKALSNFSLRYSNPSYKADRLAPRVTVEKESDRYFVYDKTNFSIPYALRADKTKTREIGYNISTDTYFCEEYGYHETISDRERENSDAALRPDIDATEHLTDCLMLDREYRIANIALDSTNPGWSGYSTTHFTNMQAAWDDLLASNPRNDFYFSKWMIFRDARRQATDTFIPVEISYQLAQMDAVDELRKYTDPNLMTNSGIPNKLWGLNVHECESTYNAADEGASTDVFTETFGNNVIVAHISNRTLSLKTLTFMLTFQRKPFETRKFWDQWIKADVVETTHLYDSKIIAPACGFVMLNCMTSQ